MGIFGLKPIMAPGASKPMSWSLAREGDSPWREQYQAPGWQSEKARYIRQSHLGCPRIGLLVARERHVLPLLIVVVVHMVKQGLPIPPLES